MTRAAWCVIACVIGVTSAARADDAHQLVEQDCVMCHAPAMLSQQVLTRAQWDKTVAKMAKWGPPLGEGQEPQLSEFLAGSQGPSAVSSGAATPTVTLAEVEARYAPEDGADRGDAKHGGEVYAKTCASCHGPDAKGLLAPSLIGRAVLSRPTDWSTVIRQGRRRMPGFDVVVNATDIQDMLAWARATSRAAVEPPLPK